MVALSALLVQPDSDKLDQRQGSAIPLQQVSVQPSTQDGHILSAVYEGIQSVFKRLQELPSFHPNEKTNAVFTDLVDFVVKTQLSKTDLYQLMQKSKMDTICQEIRRMCAEAETLLEQVRARDDSLLERKLTLSL